VLGEYWMMNHDMGIKNEADLIQTDSVKELERTDSLYNQFITEALKSSNSGRMTFEAITDYIVAHYPFYGTLNSHWKVRYV